MVTEPDCFSSELRAKRWRTGGRRGFVSLILCCHQSRQKTFASHQRTFCPPLRLEEICFSRLRTYDMARWDSSQAGRLTRIFTYAATEQGIKLVAIAYLQLSLDLCHIPDHLRHFTLCRSYYFAPEWSRVAVTKTVIWETQCDYFTVRTIQRQGRRDWREFCSRKFIKKKIAINCWCIQNQNSANERL